jgi:hypothetical protein
LEDALGEHVAHLFLLRNGGAEGALPKRKMRAKAGRKIENPDRNEGRKREEGGKGKG